MRKLVALLSILAISATALLATVSLPVNNEITKLKPALKLNEPNSARGFAGEDGGNFDNSANGYGWYNGHNNKIDVSSTGLVTTNYRQLHPTGNSGTWGGAYGAFDDLESSTIADPGADPGARYPTHVSFGGYAFGFTINYISGGGAVADPVFSVFSEAEEEWSERTQIVSPDGVMAPGAWLPDVAVNKNGSVYTAITTWEVDGLNSGTNAIIVGTSETPFEMDSWEWSDYEDLYFEVGVAHIASNGYSVGLSNSGFAGIGTTQDQDDGEYYLSYSFSEDWGQSWNLTADSKLLRVTPDVLHADVWGSAIGGGTATVTSASITYDFDVAVTNDNKLHFACYAQIGDGTSIYAYNDDGLPLTGWYDMVGTVNAAGDDLEWTANFISHKIGWDGEQSSNPGQIHIGTADNFGNNIFVTMMDRPLDATVASAWPDGNFNFVVDGFASLSPDGGSTWLTEEYVSGDDTFYHAFNVTNTPDLLEEGWAGSMHGIVDASTGTATFYAANQYFDIDNPLATVEDYYDHQQFLHAWKIVVDADVNSIDGEDVSLTKEFNLAQNYPNPFNPTTSINFVLKNSGKVNLSVFNTKGEVVSVLANEQMTAGPQSFIFNAADLNSGVYFYQLNVNGITESKKMVLTK